MTREMWSACEDGALMLKLLGRVAGPPASDTRRPLVLAACECARFALPRVKDGETRPLAAVEAAENWARGGTVTLAQVQTARDSAECAAQAVGIAAVNIEASADEGAYFAAIAAAAAANTVNGTPTDIAADAIAAQSCAPKAALRDFAVIFRKHFPEPPRVD